MPDGPDAGALLALLVARAEASPNREICGLILRAPDGALSLEPVANAAPAARAEFALAPEALLAVLRRLDRAGGAIHAVYHSHLLGGAELSGGDLAGAILGGAPVLPGVEQWVVALEAGRVAGVRAHRWIDGRFVGRDLWPPGDPILQSGARPVY